MSPARHVAMPRHPYPLIAWDTGWRARWIVTAILWNSLVLGAATFGLILWILS